jgi:hypothetical protein
MDSLDSHILPSWVPHRLKSILFHFMRGVQGLTAHHFVAEMEHALHETPELSSERPKLSENILQLLR